jgi:O-phosphoseryl-tRNA(Cys) synthetase
MDKYGDPQKATSAANAVKQKFNSDYLKKIDELSAKYEVPETQTKVNALNPSQPSFLSNRLKQANDRLDILNRGLIRTP